MPTIIDFLAIYRHRTTGGRYRIESECLIEHDGKRCRGVSLQKVCTGSKGGGPLLVFFLDYFRTHFVDITEDT